MWTMTHYYTITVLSIGLTSVTMSACLYSVSSVTVHMKVWVSLYQRQYCNCWQWLYCLLGWMLWLVVSLYFHALMLFCSPSAGAHKYFSDFKDSQLHRPRRHTVTRLRCKHEGERQKGITIKNFWVFHQRKSPHKHKTLLTVSIFKKKLFIL